MIDTLLFILLGTVLTVPLTTVVAWNAVRTLHLPRTGKVIVPAVAALIAGILLFAFSGIWSAGGRVGAFLGCLAAALLPTAALFLYFHRTVSADSSSKRLVISAAIAAFALSLPTASLILMVGCGVAGECL